MTGAEMRRQDQAIYEACVTQMNEQRVAEAGEGQPDTEMVQPGVHPRRRSGRVVNREQKRLMEERRKMMEEKMEEDAGEVDDEGKKERLLEWLDSTEE